MHERSSAARNRVETALPPRPARALVTRLVAGVASLALLSVASGARAQDYQLVPVGNGQPNTVCVRPGLNVQLQSTAAADDVPSGALGTNSTISSGPNGICETTLTGDDVYATGISLGEGLEFAPIIIAGTPGANNGICTSPITPLGDDGPLTPLGTSTPRQVGVQPKANDVLDSTPAGDDVATMMICAGDNTVFDSTVHPSDISVASDIRCSLVCGPLSCILPGADDILQTTVVGDDVALPYISTGTNGILESTPVPDDDFPSIYIGGVGQGLRDATCLGAGPDGIAQTSLCGNSTTDTSEDCDTAGDSGSCDFDCTFAECDDGYFNPVAEICDEGGNTATCDDDCTAPLCGDGVSNPAAGEECDDGDLDSGDGCDALCNEEFCGDGIIQAGIGEECDDGPGNSDTAPDACRTTCQDPDCGDGVVDPGNLEQCDDGNTKNNDDCLVVENCMLATCGDGYLHTKGTPPFEECDDGNLVADDGCDPTCVLEPLPGCGDGIVDSLCTTGMVGETCTQNADCDVTLGDGTCVLEECDDANNSKKDDCVECRDAVCGDGFTQTSGTPPYEACDDGNTQNGDGCNLACEEECGNGAIDGACSAISGGFGPDTPCEVDADCDDPPLAGNGTCIAEPCDTGIDGLCLLTPPTCSAECTIAACGNEVLECDEQCDLGTDNGVLGSGCTIDCKRNVVGGRELTSEKECPAAWTLDSAPQDLRFIKQKCVDGEACDFDAAANGTCVFSLGVCLNRPQPAGCMQGSIVAVDLVAIKTGDPVEAQAAELLSEAFTDMIDPPEAANAPNRCSAGERFKNCTNDVDCDSYLGANDGTCNVATGCSYDPPLTPDVSPPLPIAANQALACTASQLVAVPLNDNLRLRMFARRTGGMRGDRDTIRLFCVP